MIDGIYLSMRTKRAGTRRKKFSSGQGMVEFALVLPLILLLIAGIVEFGRLLTIYNGVSNSSREATRWGSVVGTTSGGTAYYYDCAGMRAAAKGTATLLTLVDSDISITYDKPNASGGYDANGSCDDTPKPTIINGYRVVVTVRGSYAPIMPFVSTIVGSRVYVSTSARSIFPNMTGAPECSDGIDNDGDGLIDMADPQCVSTGAVSESIAPVIVCNTLTTGNGAGGTVNVNPNPDPNCTGSNAGKFLLVTLEAVPSANYGFVNWTNGPGGAALSTTNPITLNPPDASKTYYANFSQNCYVLTVSPTPANGTISSSTTNCVSGSTPGYTVNTSVTLTAIGSPGYAFYQWTGADDNYSNPTQLLMTANKTVTATFVSTSCYTLKYTASVTGGSAAPSRTGTCGENDKYNSGTPFTLTATPSVGYGFVKWTNGAGGATVSQEATLTFGSSNNPDPSITYTPVFQVIVCKTLTLTAGSGGTVTKNPASSVSCTTNKYPVGTTVTLSETPNTGYNFNGWVVNGGALNTAASITVTLTNDTTVSASFTAICYTGLALSKYPNVSAVSVSIGTIASSPNGTCSGGYTYNTVVNISATATGGSGYSFVSWSGASPTNTASSQVTIYGNNTTATARFRSNCAVPSTLALASGTTQKLQVSYSNYTLTTLTLDKLVITFPATGSNQALDDQFDSSNPPTTTVSVISGGDKGKSPLTISNTDTSYWVVGSNRGMLDGDTKQLLMPFNFTVTGFSSGSFSAAATFNLGLGSQCTATVSYP